MSKTRENLEQALAGESQAYFRYQGFAEKAEEENYPGVARLFRAVARSEMVHALSHQCALGTGGQALEGWTSPETIAAGIARLKSEGAIKHTVENLESAVDGETHEFKKMYPAMVQDAVQDKDMQARHSFEYAMSIEMIHARLFKKALEDPHANRVALYYVCPVCGYIVADEPPKKCPYCGVDATKFIEVT